MLTNNADSALYLIYFVIPFLRLHFLSVLQAYRCDNVFQLRNLGIFTVSTYPDRWLQNCTSLYLMPGYGAALTASFWLVHTGKVLSRGKDAAKLV